MAILAKGGQIEELAGLCEDTPIRAVAYLRRKERAKFEAAFMALEE
jgi:hypothetical protein